MKNDVDEYLKEKAVKVESLPPVLKQMHSVFSEIKKLHEGRKETGEHLKQLEKVGSSFIKRYEKEFPTKKEQKETKPKAKKTAVSKEDKVVEKTPKVLENLSACKQLIKEDRKRKIASGEIKKPVQQTRYTKLKNAFVRVLKSIPGQSKENIQKTKKALAESVKKIFELHGWKQWEVIDKLLEKIAKQQIKKLEKSAK